MKKTMYYVCVLCIYLAHHLPTNTYSHIDLQEDLH